MHFFDLHNRHSWLAGSPPIATPIVNNTPQVSPIIDLQGLWGLELQYILGVLGTAASTYTLSGTQGNAANLSDGVAMVAAADIIGGVFPVYTQGIDDGFVRTVGYKCSTFRFVRFTLTPAGNATTAFVVSAFLAKPKNYGILS
jgi:hypothetical protein